VESGSGALRLGLMALDAVGGAGNYAAGITAADIGATDPDVISSCVGGCFDFEITGLVNGASVNAVLPLDVAMPANAVYRKFANGEWRSYSLLGNDALSSAPGGPGTCPAPGDAAYQAGLNAGDFCVQLTISDGGRNDADGTANGTVVDPGGIGGAQTVTGGGTTTASNPPSLGGGCVLAPAAHSTVAQRADWWLITGLLGWLGFSAVRRRRSR